MTIDGARPLPRFLIEILRSFRHAAYLFLMPFDYVCRLINGKSDFPPLHLRRYVGPLRTFEASGAEFMIYLRLLVRLQPQESLLDVGCGCGLMAIFLKDYFAPGGHYAGVDIHQPSIKWCANRIGKQHHNFQFQHIDVRNRAFNPNGTTPAEQYKFSFEAQCFDVILLKSVFTHMRPEEVENYLCEVARMLKVGGRCLITLFLLNEEQARLSDLRKEQMRFEFGEGSWRYLHKHRPESAVAYDESYLRDVLTKSGLILREPIFYGRWAGRTEGLSFQDMLLVQKA